MKNKELSGERINNEKAEVLERSEVARRSSRWESVSKINRNHAAQVSERKS